MDRRVTLIMVFLVREAVAVEGRGGQGGAFSTGTGGEPRINILDLCSSLQPLCRPGQEWILNLGNTGLTLASSG